MIAINGINVSQASLTEAYEIMKQCRGTTLFLIEYDVAIVGQSTSFSLDERSFSPSESIKHATGPLLIEIEKSPGTSVGLTLTQKWTRASQSIIVIDNVKPASIADRSVFLFVSFFVRRRKRVFSVAALCIAAIRSIRSIIDRWSA